MTATRSSPKPKPGQAGAAPRSRFGLRHLMFAVVIVALALAAMVQFGVELLVFALVLLPVMLLVGVIVVLFKKREAEQNALLRFLAIAAERRMPLAPGVEACGELCGGRYRRRCLGLSRLIESGVPLPAALDAIPGLLPKPALVLACVGWAEGALPAALREAEHAVEARRAYRYAFGPKIAYLFGILLAMQVVLGFIFYFIVPKFEAIFMDFGVALPEITRASIHLSHLLMSTGLLPLLFLVELAVLAYLPLSYLGYVRWEPPPLPWLLRRRDTAVALRTLAVGIEAGRPLVSILANLARIYPRRRVRGQLERAMARVHIGEPWIGALRTERLISSSDVAVLEAAESAGNLPWALRTLADTHERRQGYRLATISQLLFPLVVLFLAAIVALFVISLFLPLVQLIDTLAVTW